MLKYDIADISHSRTLTQKTFVVLFQNPLTDLLYVFNFTTLFNFWLGYKPFESPHWVSKWVKHNTLSLHNQQNQDTGKPRLKVMFMNKLIFHCSLWCEYHCWHYMCQLTINHSGVLYGRNEWILHRMYR